MKNSLLVLIIGVLVFSVSQSVPLSYAAQGDIGSVVDSLEFDTDIAITPQILQINGDYFAVVYESSSDSVVLKTFTVGSTGTIGDSVTDTQTVDGSLAATPKIMHITNDKYLVIYEDNGQIHGSVWTISNTGVITNTAVTAGAQIGSVTGTDPDIVLLSGTPGGTQYYAIAYRTSGGNGAIQTISVPAAGTSISAVENLGTIGDTASDIEIVKLGDHKTAVAYRDSSNIGKVKVVNISDDGTDPNVTGVPSTVSLNSGTALSSSSDLDFVHVTGTVYAVSYSDSSNAGKIETLAITSSGSSVSSTSVGSSFGSNVVSPTLIQTDNASSPYAFLVAYYDSSATDGLLKSFTITNTGTISSVIDNITFDSSNGQNPSLFHRTGDYYAVVLQGAAGDGFVKSFNLGDPDTTKPTLTGTVRITEAGASAPLDNFSKQGDSVTVIFTASEEVQTPVVTFSDMSGVSVSYTNTGGNTWNATAVIPSTADEGTVDFSISVTDLAGNAINTPVTATTDSSSVTIDLTNPGVSTLKVGESSSVNGDADFAKSGDTMEVQLVANEQLSAATITIASLTDDSMTGSAPTTSWTESSIALSTEGEVTFSIKATDRAGNQATFTQSSITDGSSVTYDTTAPTLSSAKITGQKSINFVFSEPVISTDTGHYPNIEFPDNTGNAATSVSGSGTDTILVILTNNVADTTNDVQYDITAGVLDRAGNAFSAVSNQVLTTDFVQPTLTSSDNTVALSDDTSVTTITATTSVAPELSLSGLTSGTGTGNTATIPQEITVDTDNADVVFPSGVIASDLPSDEIIEVSVSTKTVDTDVVSGTVGTIIELGDPDTTIRFSAPVKVTLPNQAGNTAFIITTTQTVLVPTCTTGSATAAPTLSSTDPTSDNSHCSVDAGVDLVVWTRHFTGFGSTTSSSGGGGSGNDGDNTKPSISIGFDENEIPLRYAGVNYDAETIDKVHTAIITTGEELKATLKVYENEGPGNVRHAEMYVNQFGSRILNDLSETIVIYDEQSGLEIVDPHDLIATADVVPSVVDNKAVFDFVIVFNGEVPQSDVLFRIWDLNRNSMEIHMPDALIVNLGEQSSNIVTIEPEIGTSDTESEPSSTETVPSIPSDTTQTPQATPVTPESTPEGDVTKSWTDNQLSVLKKWGGFDNESASDADVLAKFGIKGEMIPTHYKQLVKWIMNGQVSQEEFVNALQWLKRQGFLSDSVAPQSFDINSSTSVEELTVNSESIDNNIQFENELSTMTDLANFDDVVKILRSLANNMEIQNELVASNTEFRTYSDVNDVIDQRESEWQQNPKNVTPFMESLMNNDAALIASTVIELHSDDLVPLTNIVVTNEYGVNVAMTEKTDDYKQSDEQWWSKTKSSDVYVVSGSSSEEYTGLHTAEISIPVKDSQDNFIGIIKAVVNIEKALLLE